MNKRRLSKVCAPALAAAALAVAGAAQAQAFPEQDFIDRGSSYQRKVTTVFSGVSQEFGYVGGPGGVTGFGPASGGLETTFKESIDAKNFPSEFHLINANRDVGFAPTSAPPMGDTIVGGQRLLPTAGLFRDRVVQFAVIRASDWTRQLTLFDVDSNARYQVFGFWQSGVGMASGSIGGFSAGAKTTGAATPQSGSTQFTGWIGGVHVGETGQSVSVVGAMGMAVNFAAHTADFWSTKMFDLEGRAHEDLNLTGSFVGLAGYPRLFGTLNTSALTGTGVALFYGPAAEEIGGVFTLAPKSGQGLQRFAGGFGGTRGEPPPPALDDGAGFTSWSAALKPSTTVSASGIANPEESLSLSEPAAFTQTFDAAGAVTALKMQTTKVSASFYTAYGDTIVRSSDPGYLVAKASDWTRTALVADPRQMGWDYQTFGAWEVGPGSTRFGASAMSTGAVTPTANLPTAGVAQFSGSVGGIYFDEVGADHLLSGRAAAGVDFAARTIQFDAGGLTDVVTGQAYAKASITGVLKINSSGAKETTGSLFAKGFSGSRDMAGIAWANFYGPNAQELGGVFDLTEISGALRFAGGFGLKR